ncbi:MAG: tRNA epoxyqueuosine(34) reductase QueG [Muribaculaceae bacterium]|nr:tRNA epoxyqueuosine(34) reductase QueG [Muribaculaceae bacterium]
MNELSRQNKEDIRKFAIDAGFEACGFTEALPVSDEAVMQYDRWIEASKHYEMKYLERYHDVRCDPRKLLDGAKSIIAVALNYYPAVLQPRDVPQFAYYAYGRDYHEVVREKLNIVAKYIDDTFDARSRVCVDTAPLRERYWAQRAGIGFVARNNQLILPGKGSYFFLGFIISTLEIPSDKPCDYTCGNCRRCVACCPTHALNEDGACDARKCLSCLTIEYHGDLPDDLRLGKRIYGCDMCQQACPHNRGKEATKVLDFKPSEEFLALDKEAISAMSDDDFRNIFRHSAVKRAKLVNLKRNLNHLD